MEQQNIPETKEKKKTNIGSVLLLLGALMIFAGVAMITFFPEEEKQEQVQSPSEETTQQKEAQLGQAITLSKQTEEVKFDENLRIKFIGTASTDVEGGFKYKAEIYLNNELINDNFYTGSNIFSEGYAANFTVYKLQNVYIIKSFLATQCGGSDVLIISEDKTSIVPHANVSVEIDEGESSYTISKCSDCMNEATCEKTTVNVSKLTN